MEWLSENVGNRSVNGEMCVNNSRLALSDKSEWIIEQDAFRIRECPKKDKFIVPDFSLIQTKLKTKSQLNISKDADTTHNNDFKGEIIPCSDFHLSRTFPTLRLSDQAFDTPQRLVSGLTDLRVKKLEAQIKVGKARRHSRFVLSDAEDDSSKQGRKFSKEGFKDDEGGQEKASTETELFIQEITPTEINGTYSRRSAEKRKDKGKGIMTDEEPKKKSKKELEQERLSFAEAIRIEEQMHEEQRAQIARDAEIARQWDEEERKRVMDEAKATKKIDCELILVHEYRLEDEQLSMLHTFYLYISGYEDDDIANCSNALVTVAPLEVTTTNPLDYKQKGPATKGTTSMEMVTAPQITPNVCLTEPESSIVTLSANEGHEEVPVDDIDMMFLEDIPFLLGVSGFRELYWGQRK
ncbi:hypothetical protein Tco_0216659 [Tanacetum coccineum]